MKIQNLLGLMVALATSACNSGPDHRRPEIALPSSYSTQGAVRSVSPQNATWWKSLHDDILDALVDRGLKQNLDIEQARERIVAARASVIVSNSGNLVASASSEVDSAGRSTDLGVTGSTTATGNANGAVIVDLFGATRRAKQSALASLDAAFTDVEATRLRFFSDLASHYVEVRYYQQAQLLTQQSVSSRREILRLTRLLQQAGGATRLDSAQAEAAIGSAMADLPGLDEGFRRSAHRIATLLGLPATSLLDELNVPRPQPEPSDAVDVGVPADLIRNRPDIRGAERRLAAASARIGVTQAALFPSFRLQGTIGLSQLVQSAISGGTTSWSFGPNITVPIFNGGELRARVDIARSQAREQYLVWRKTVLAAVEDVENSLVAVRRDRESVAALRKAGKSYEESLVLARRSYQLKTGSILALVELDKSVSEQRLALAAALRKLAQDYIALNVSIGGGYAVGGNVITAAGQPADSQ